MDAIEFRNVCEYEFVEYEERGVKDLFQVRSRTPLKNGSLMLHLHRIYDDVIHARDIFIFPEDSKNLRRLIE